MDGLRALISSSKNVLNAKYYEEFVINTIKTCGYNSDTYTLFNNLKNNINPTKYKNDLLNTLKECAREYNASEDVVKSIKMKDSYKELRDEMKDIIPQEDFDGIMFDLNVSMVEDYMDYDRIKGNKVLDNIDKYLEKFETGVNLIDGSPDYSQVKEDIFNDAGLSLSGLESLKEDTSPELDFSALEEDSNDINLDLEQDRKINR